MFFRYLIYLFAGQSLDGISDIRDESDRSGMRIVIEVCIFELVACLFSSHYNSIT